VKLVLFQSSISHVLLANIHQLVVNRLAVLVLPATTVLVQLFIQFLARQATIVQQAPQSQRRVRLDTSVLLLS